VAADGLEGSEFERGLTPSTAVARGELELLFGIRRVDDTEDRAVAMNGFDVDQLLGRGRRDGRKNGDLRRRSAVDEVERFDSQRLLIGRSDAHPAQRDGFTGGH
jgi:hypothetical protein